MKRMLLNSLFVLISFLGVGTHSSFGQKKNSSIESVNLVEQKLPDNPAVYQGDFKQEFLTDFFKSIGKIVMDGDEFKFVISLIINEKGVVEEVMVLGGGSTIMKERMESIAKSLAKWTPEVKEGKYVKSQVTVPFVIKDSDFIMSSAELNKLLEASKEKSQNNVYTETDVRATYPDGLRVFQQEFIKLFTPPTFEGDKLRFAITFVVERDGTVSDIKLIGISGPNQDQLLKKIENAFNQLKKWTPATQDGKQVRSEFTLPFTLQKY